MKAWNPDFWSVSQELLREQEPFVVVTLAASRGAAPADPGAKAVITSQGIRSGTVGGGKVEARAIEHARRLLETKTTGPELLTWNLQRDIGMTCGGEVTYLFEVFQGRRWRVAIFGAGHVAQALARTLEPLSFHVTCIDQRPEWIERLPRSGSLQVRCLKDAASAVVDFSADTFFVVMTQGHAMDVPILTEIFRHFPDAPYIGVIGSKVKGLKIRAELQGRGITEDLLTRLRCPIGLPIGNNDPAEIAISIAAQLLQVRDEQLRS